MRLFYRRCPDMKNLLTVAALLMLFAGCAQTSGIRDYDSLMAANETKRVDYYCDFEKIAGGTYGKFGDYCQFAPNQDYVSYFVSFDIQATDIYRPFLIQTVNMISSDAVPGQLRYYQMFSDNEFLKLTKFDMNNAPVTSFALKNGGRYHEVISKSDLLARTKIYPELSILSMKAEGQSEPVTIGDYTVRYRVAPYVFDMRYSDSETARILGLPEYSALAGRLSGVQKLQLNNYESGLDKFWLSPDKYKYTPGHISIMDYAIPRIMLSKPDMPSELTLRVTPPPDGEGLLNDCLPPYSLTAIQYVHVAGFGSERILQSFNQDEISKTIISYEDDALVYSTDVNHDSLGIRFIYKANAPRARNMPKRTSDDLGLSYIYSSIAATIETQINVLRFYEIEKMPRSCVDETAFIAAFVSRGRSENEARALLGRMNQTAKGSCTAVQESIAELLVNLY